MRPASPRPLYHLLVQMAKECGPEDEVRKRMLVDGAMSMLLSGGATIRNLPPLRPVAEPATLALLGDPPLKGCQCQLSP